MADRNLLFIAPNTISSSRRMAGFAGKWPLLFLYLLGSWAGFVAASESAAAMDERVQRCAALNSTDFSKTADAPTDVVAAELKINDARYYCAVMGFVAPAVGFQIRLPAKAWNGKLLALGCGGLCGSTSHIEECEEPVRRGYACMVSDLGHTAPGAIWIYNNFQAQLDIFYRATHVSTLAGKEIVKRYYGRLPETSYFMGCSGGGHEAMMEAQRFPWDFDGIVAGCPSLAPVRNLMNYIWANRVMAARAVPPLTQRELDLLHRAVIEKCDLNDGLEDGLVGDPRLCDFDPVRLLCESSRTTRCLTERQVDLVRKLYGAPTNSSGEPISLPFLMRGSEKKWLLWFKESEWLRIQSRVFFQPDPGPEWRTEDFDFDRDYKRLGMGEILSSATNPDLRQFKAGGGKLLSYIGWNDLSNQTGTVDYYETVEKTMGGRAATQEFFRLFAVPGMEHCGGGDGASTIDWLTYLEKWVEQGRAPDLVVGSHVRTDDLRQKAESGDQSAARELKRRQTFPLDPATIEFSRPIYPYPTRTRYLGHGDPNDAASFGVATP
jgi:feruloyl esterase